MYLRLNTRFKPFTYDELIRPLADYGKAYKEVEEAYSTLSEQTEAFKDEVNQANSPDAYKMYKQYSDVLNTVVDDFSQGMTGANRAKLLGMKRDYARSIVPIAKASEAMRAANALRDQAGPDAIFEVGRYNSLDDFLHGKTANNRYQSASAITKKTAAMTEAVMQKAMEDPEFKEFLNGQQYMITQHTGGSYEDLMAAIANNPSAQNKFAEIKQQVMASMGMERYDAQGQAAIEDAINTGLYAGLDKPVRNFVANGEYVTKAQRQQLAQSAAHHRDSMALNAAAHGLTKNADGTYTYDPEKDPALKKAKEHAKQKAQNSPNGGKALRIKNPIKLSYNAADGDGYGSYETTQLPNNQEVTGGDVKAYNALPEKVRKDIGALIGGDDPNAYVYMFKEYKKGDIYDDDAELIMLPMATVGVGTYDASGGDNDY